MNLLNPLPPQIPSRPHSPAPRRQRHSAWSRRTCPSLTFSPLAWLKLQFFCHAGDTEVGGFGISSPSNLLYIDDFVTVAQKTSVVTVQFDDAAVADHFDAMSEQGIVPARCGRVWIHTHPGFSAEPSGVDEETFGRVFGSCDWALMFIVACSGQTYARLRFNAGPSGELLLPVETDWAAWPGAVAEQSEAQPLSQRIELWMDEYGENVWPELEAAGSTTSLLGDLRHSAASGVMVLAHRAEAALTAQPVAAGGLRVCTGAAGVPALRLDPCRFGRSRFLVCPRACIPASACDYDGGGTRHGEFGNVTAATLR